MKKSIKRITTLALSAIMLLSSVAVASAAETNTANTQTPVSTAAITEPDAEIQADTIIWKYRIYNGVLQKRRWNNTVGVWVDPEWINA